MRIVVTGKEGQIVSAIIERGLGKAEIIALGRTAVDLTNRDSVFESLFGARPNTVINAAAYTAVDKTEREPVVAMCINADGGGFVAEATAALGVPLLHLSTDYVFDGALKRRYREDDPTAPTGAYGRSKLAGEQKVTRLCPDSAILRTAWLYSPFGVNFVRTMQRLRETRHEVGVVADQIGSPTSALDIADALLILAERLHTDTSLALRGVFHMTGAGEASWADLAEVVFLKLRLAAEQPCESTADYPTPAKRPANSRLNNSKLRRAFGVVLPHWRTSTAACVGRAIG
jgi:dTDP-4-dehydrorhamnose reductase